MTDPAAACLATRPHLAELALGALDGRRRGEVLAHLDRCSACAREAGALAQTADLLCELALPVVPPPHLARAVLGRGRAGGAARRRRVRQRLLLGAAAAGLLGGGLLAGRLALPAGGSHSGADRPPAALGEGPVASPRHPATLTSLLRAPSGAVLGSVVVRSGRHPSLVVWLAHRPAATIVQCVAETRAGRRMLLGAYPTSSASWSVPLSVRADTLASAELTSPEGALVARASLSW